MTDLPNDPEIAHLRVVAEDPMVRPSVRVAARQAIRAYREAIEQAKGEKRAVAAMRARIASDVPLGWRERKRARESGLIGGQRVMARWSAEPDNLSTPGTDGRKCRRCSAAPGRIAQPTWKPEAHRQGRRFVVNGPRSELR